MNKRQLEFLEMLYKNSEYVTVGYLANKANVSTKTVRNDIAFINDFLSRISCGQIVSKPHVGIRADISSDDWNTICKESVVKEDRKIIFFILRKLFSDGELTALKLSQSYYISRTQIERIFEYIEKWLAIHNIILIRKRGKGIYIKYDEFDFRQAFLSFCNEYFDLYAEIITSRQSHCTSISQKEYTGICAALNGFDADCVGVVLKKAESKFGIVFSHVSNINLLFSISLSILRQRENNVIEIMERIDYDIISKSDEMIATFIYDGLKEKFAVKPSNGEFEYILFCISVSEIQEFSNQKSANTYEIMNIELCTSTVKAVNIVSEISGVNLKCDSFFVRQLFLILKPMLARLKQGIVLKNKLLYSIRQKYPNVFAIAWSLSRYIEKEKNIEFNDHETGLLALHIGGAIERTLIGLRAVIICDYGIGVSQIIREKIERSIPELTIDGVYSLRDIREIRNKRYDFIISTVPLDEYKLTGKIVFTDHIINSEDIKTIRDYMHEIRLGKKSAIQIIKPTTLLFNRELIFMQCEVKDKTQFLCALCERMEKMGFVTRDFSNSVVSREKSMATDVGEGIALPHGDSEFVNRSTIAFASLKEPIKWSENIEGHDGYVDLIFLLAVNFDESKEVKDKIIGFYKSFVTFADDKKACKKIRLITDKDKMMEILKLW